MLTLHQCIYIQRPSSLHLSYSIPNQTQIQKPIICARNKNRRSGSVRSVKIMLHSAYIIASKLNIIPEPVHFVLREFVGGNNGGGGWLGFNKSFGWGGFDGRRRNKKIEFFGFMIVLGMWVWFIFGKEVNVDVFLGFFVFSLVWFSTIWGKINVQDWFLGFCSCAFLMVLGMRREKLKKWAKDFKIADIFRTRRRTRSRLWTR